MVCWFQSAWVRRTFHTLLVTESGAPVFVLFNTILTIIYLLLYGFLFHTKTLTHP